MGVPFGSIAELSQTQSIWNTVQLSETDSARVLIKSWIFACMKLLKWGEQGWRSGKSACLPPMWPGFNSRTRRHMWVEFVVGSLLCSERFFSWYSGLPLSLKTNISKFQFDSGMHKHFWTSSCELLSAPWVNKLLLHFYEAICETCLLHVLIIYICVQSMLESFPSPQCAVPENIQKISSPPTEGSRISLG